MKQRGGGEDGAQEEAGENIPLLGSPPLPSHSLAACAGTGGSYTQVSPALPNSVTLCCLS